MATAKQVAVLIIGDEILEGSTVDTNSTTLIRWANAQGHRVVSIQTISDQQTVIIEALNRARRDGAEMIVTTGGVGPTIDDLTVDAVAAAANKMNGAKGCLKQSKVPIQACPIFRTLFIITELNKENMILVL